MTNVSTAVEVMEGNLRAMLGTFGRARPDGGVEAWDGLTAVSSAVNFSMFNAACLTAKVAAAAELDARIACAAEYYADRKLPWSFWLCDYWVDSGLHGEIQEVFRRRGMHLALEMPGMWAEALKPVARSCEPLEYRPVGDTETRTAFANLMYMVFGIPARAAMDVYGARAFWDGALSGWLAYRDGVPVASAATLVEGAIGVYAVGTLPAHRRRGYGEAVMRYAMARAAEESGIGASVLEASQAGFHMYRLMGYKPLARYAVFASRR
jgi:GNAT superfamily N-acetyltransferase